MKPKSRSTGGQTATPPTTPHPTPYKGDRGVGGVAMSRQTVNEAKTLIDAMTKEQRKEVADYIAFLGQGRRATRTAQDLKSNRDLGLWGDALVAALGQALPSLVTSKHIPASVIQQLEQSSVVAESIISQAAIPASQSYMRNAFYRLLANLLVQHSRSLAKYVKAPLSLKFCLGQVDGLHGLVEDAYPGYLRSGMMKVVLQQMKKQ